MLSEMVSLAFIDVQRDADDAGSASADVGGMDSKDMVFPLAAEGSSGA